MLKSIKIKRFRKFKSLEDIQIGSRLTLISGANGIGKSTLLGIIASGSGTEQFKNLQNKKFHPEFKNYFILKSNEFKNRNDPNEYQVILNYQYKSTNICKRMKLSHPSTPKLVPRTCDENGVSNTSLTTSIQNATNVTESGRIPIPTMYLSTSRLFPFGEANSDDSNQKNISTRAHLIDVNELITKYKEMYNSVLPNSISEETSLLVETKKPKIDSSNFYVPLDAAEVLTQSVGQDSLSGIINALLAFYNISGKVEYGGGILCIDELDISLHPDAQLRLLKLLKKEAQSLNLQIIFTSHSLTIIKEMLRLEQHNSEQYKVLYFRNNNNPILKSGNTYTNIKADLFRKIHFNSPKVKLYFEDEEAVFLFSEILKIYLNLNSGQQNIRDLCELIPSQIGCDILAKLPEKDSYFQDVIIILDGDAKYKKQPKLADYILTDPENLNPKENNLKNILFLPGDFSPEALIYRILYEISAQEEEHEEFWNFVKDNINIGNYYPELILSELKDLENSNSLNRDKLKEWFKLHTSFFKQSNLIKYYFIDYKKDIEIITEFGESLIKLISIKLSILKSKGF